MLPHGTSSRIEQCQIEHIAPNPWQPRLQINDSELTGLIESIHRFGFSGHLEVRHDPMNPHGKLQLVFGHRRLRAAQVAGLTTVPVVIDERTDQKMIELAYIENSTHLPLPYWDEALFFGRLQEEFGFTFRQLAEHLGVSKGYVQARLDLLKIPVESPIRQAVRERAIDLTAASVLFRLSHSLGPRQLEDLVSQVRSGAISGSDLVKMKRGGDGRAGQAVVTDGDQPAMEQSSPPPSEAEPVSSESMLDQAHDMSSTGRFTGWRLSENAASPENTPNLGAARPTSCGHDDELMIETGRLHADGTEPEVEPASIRDAYRFLHDLRRMLTNAETLLSTTDLDLLSPQAQKELDELARRMILLGEAIQSEEPEEGLENDVTNRLPLLPEIRDEK